jgi:cytochrome P450
LDGEDVRYDPMDYAVPNPWTELAADRQACPVARNRHGFYQALSYDAVSEVLRHPERFSSRSGNNLARPGKNTDVLIYADPPVHSRQRRLMIPAFAPARVNRLEPYARKVADDLLDGVSDGAFELIEQYSNPFAMTTMGCVLLSIPIEQRPTFRRWTLAIEAETAGAPAEAWEADVAECEEYFRRELRARAEMDDPPDDLMTVLVRSQLENQPIEEDAVLFMLRILLSAGNGTTTDLITNAVWLLDQHPGQKRRFLSDVPGMVGGLVDETLRYDGPIRGIFRTATRDTAVAGCPIPAGSRVYASLMGGGHDETAFEGADDFIIDRDWNTIPPQLGFGTGPHQCVGLNFARLVGRVGLETLYSRLPNLRVRPGFQPVHRHSPIRRGFHALELIADAKQPRTTDPSMAVTPHEYKIAKVAVPGRR